MNKYPQNKSGSSQGTKRPIKTAGYCRDTANAKRDCRRRDAISRQAIYDGLSMQDKLALTVSRRGDSAREYNRLNARNS